MAPQDVTDWMFLKDGKLIGGYTTRVLPYWGPNVSYTRKKVIVKDVNKNINVNKNVYFGRRHFVRDQRGGHRA